MKNAFEHLVFSAICAVIAALMKWAFQVSLKTDGLAGGVLFLGGGVLCIIFAVLSLIHIALFFSAIMNEDM